MSNKDVLHFFVEKWSSLVSFSSILTKYLAVLWNSNGVVAFQFMCRKKSPLYILQYYQTRVIGTLNQKRPLNVIAVLVSLFL